jgi:hypothetical protein
VLETAISDAEEVEARISSLAEEFLREKPYLLRSWG